MNMRSKNSKLQFLLARAQFEKSDENEKQIADEGQKVLLREMPINKLFEEYNKLKRAEEYLNKNEEEERETKKKLNSDRIKRAESVLDEKANELTRKGDNLTPQESEILLQVQKARRNWIDPTERNALEEWIRYLEQEQPQQGGRRSKKHSIKRRSFWRRRALKRRKTSRR